MAFSRQVIIRILAASLICAVAASASTILYTGSSDDKKLNASAQFSYSGNTLELTVLNTSAILASKPEMVLTGVFFKLDNDVPLTPQSGTLSSGSTFLNGNPASNTVGANWGYNSRFQFSSISGWMGVGTAGLGIFSSGNFGCGPGNPCQNVDGLGYGIVPAINKPGDGTGGMKSVTLIDNGITLTFAANTQPVISNVWFQYGTSLSEGGFYGTTEPSGGAETPEPQAVVLTGLGVVCLVGSRFLRRRFQ